jgi:hypothetical protein
MLTLYVHKIHTFYPLSSKDLSKNLDENVYLSSVASSDLAASEVLMSYHIDYLYIFHIGIIIQLSYRWSFS